MIAGAAPPPNSLDPAEILGRWRHALEGHRAGRAAAGFCLRGPTRPVLDTPASPWRLPRRTLDSAPIQTSRWPASPPLPQPSHGRTSHAMVLADPSVHADTGRGGRGGARGWPRGKSKRRGKPSSERDEHGERHEATGSRFPSRAAAMSGGGGGEAVSGGKREVRSGRNESGALRRVLSPAGLPARGRSTTPPMPPRPWLIQLLAVTAMAMARHGYETGPLRGRGVDRWTLVRPPGGPSGESGTFGMAWLVGRTRVIHRCHAQAPTLLDGSCSG